MLSLLKPKEEKKVEYLELIYDLIFVYIIGTNNSLLHHIENGFVPGTTFLIYVLCSLAVIQIWNFSTFYINLFGRNSVRDHVSLFLNMYLLYYIAEGTRLHWESFQNQYHIAWVLILLNVGVQYAVEYFRRKDDREARKTIRNMMIVLFGEAALVLAAIPVYNATGIALAGVPILYGIVATALLSGGKKSCLVDFSHLTERAMLYVVFTFGEMIIAIAGYFEGEFTFGSVFFSAASFLIVVGLLLCYGLLYDRIVQRDRRTNGILYMILHIFLIFGLNSVTTSLEFMRDEEVALWPKTLFLIGSFLLVALCFPGLLYFSKPELKQRKRILLPGAVATAAFAVLMVVLRENMYANILVTLAYVFGVFACLFIYAGKKGKEAPPPDEAETP